MSFEFKTAWRYFRARRKNLARFTAIVAVAGIAAGVAALILAQSLANGFADEMRDKILANTAHVSVFSVDGAAISGAEKIEEKLKTFENVKEIVPTVFENAAVASANANAYAVLRVVPDSPMRDANSNRIDIALGRRLAEKINVKIGDEAEILTFENESQPQAAKARVGEIFQTGLYEYDATWIKISPENFARLKAQKVFTPTVFNIAVKDIYAADRTAAAIRETLGANFKVIDWREANEPLFAALALERRVALAIISLIVFVAVLNITTTLALLVNERRLDIAVLRTCGATAKTLLLIFLLEGLFLSAIGIFLGAVVGLAGCFLGNYFKVINLPTEVYSLSSIPFHPDAANILLIIFTAFLLCLAAIMYPAFKASRVKPLENLRTR